MNPVRRWLYHPIEGGRIFEGEEIAARRAAGWYDSPKLFPKEPPVEAPVESGAAPKRGRKAKA